MFYDSASSMPLSVTKSERANALFGAWSSWLFDAMDAGIFSFILLAVAHSFNTDLSGVAIAVAWFLLATGVGGYLFGNLCDRIGRKRTLWICVGFCGVGTLLCGFSQSMLQLYCFRIIVGLSVGGLWSAATALVSETARPEKRTRSLAIMQTGWSGGQLLAAVFAWAVLDHSDSESWRTLFFVASIPALLTALYVMTCVKESPIWLANRHYVRKNNIKQGMGSIFRPGLLKTTLLGVAISVLGMFGYWIIITFVPSYLGKTLGIAIDQTPVFMVMTGVGATIGYLGYGVIAKRMGHRKTFALFFAGMTIMIPVFVYIASHMPLVDGHLTMDKQNIAILGSISALLGFFTGYFSGFGAWFGELFPTSVRATASGFCFNFGRVGAIAGILLAPLIISALGFSGFIMLASLSYLAGAILVFAGRETNGRILSSEE